MKTFHISRAGKILGIFGEEEVREGVRVGRFQKTDFAWAEGMPEWKRLGEISEFEAVSPPPVPPALADETGWSRPGASFEKAPAFEAAEGVEPGRTGLPWEAGPSGRSIASFLETLRLVVFNPAQAFERMKLEGGFEAPVLFGVIGVVVFGLIGAFSLSLLLSVLPSTPGRGLQGQGVISILVQVLVVPVFWVLGLFVRSAVVHFLLGLLGGRRRPFEATLRVFAYVEGALIVLQVIPVCGSFLYGVLGMVYSIMGVSRVHQTGTGKSIVANLLPTFVCCCLPVFAGVYFLSHFAGESGVFKEMLEAFSKAVEEALRH